MAAAAPLVGCANPGPERRLFITSEPVGATVFLNDVEVGRTPVEVDFTWFGTYDVRLRKPGFEPLRTSAQAKAPIHEWPILDLVAMALPGREVTRIDWHFTMEPAAEGGRALASRAAAARDDANRRNTAGDDPESASPPEGDTDPGGGT